MKIRTDFVSNSSSSSFVFWGSSYTVEEVIDAFRKDISEEHYNALKKDNSWWPEYNDFLEELNGGDSDYWQLYEILSLNLGDSVYDSDAEEMYFGLSPDKQLDSETLGDFKKRISSEIRKYFPSLKDKQIELYRGVDSDGEICFD